MLTQTNAIKDKLFAIIGHDLRSPINSLKGLMELLENQNISPEEFMRISHKLKNGVEYVHFTLNNLLVWANNQLQGQQSNPKNIDLYKLATENINLLGEIAQAKTIALHNNFSQNLQVWADTDQINLVLRNLISNAIKFTQEGGTVSLTSERTADYWEMAVSDTGIGMSKEDLDKLFNKVTHFSTYGTRGEKGTGLGLLLCQEMIEKKWRKTPGRE
jgi:signal transduction histidine kinase